MVVGWPYVSIIADRSVDVLDSGETLGLDMGQASREGPVHIFDNLFGDSPVTGGVSPQTHFQGFDYYDEGDIIIAESLEERKGFFAVGATIVRCINNYRP